MKSLRNAILASVLALGLTQAHAEDGVTDTSITLGMSSPFTGPNGLYGMQMREAMTAYFDQINKSGGINGRKIELITIDDGYESGIQVGVPVSPLVRRGAMWRSSAAAMDASVWAGQRAVWVMW